VSEEDNLEISIPAIQPTPPEETSDFKKPNPRYVMQKTTAKATNLGTKEKEKNL